MTEERKGVSAWLRGIIGEYEAEGERSCSAMARMFGIDCEYETCRRCMTKMMTVIADRIDAERALPEGMEWPRFEDGELVKVGDEVEFEGEAWEVDAICFDREEWSMALRRNLDISRMSGSYGERVKRPTPKVLDADGAPIEVGDTVYLRSNGREGKVVGFYEDKGETWVGETWVSVSYELGSDRMTVNTEGKALTHERPDSWRLWGEDLDMAVKAGEVDKVEMMRRAKALAKREVG